MRQADFKAKIKKIEIVNKVLTEDWQQSIRVILDDIELNNENLLELRQFKPNETVVVNIKPLQVSLFDSPEILNDSIKQPEETPPKLRVVKSGQKEPGKISTEEFFYVEEEDIDNEGPGGDPYEDYDLVKEWRFDRDE